jgi:hypothetical protein
MTLRFGLFTAILLAGACGGGAANVQAGPMPENGTYTGVYFSPQYGEMHLVQNGSAVHGKFKKDERFGEIQGEAEDNLLRFEWTEHKAMIANRPQETKGRGYFHYMVDPASGDHVLKGRWGIEDESSGGEWNAYKSRSREPDLESMGGEGSGSGGEEAADDDLFGDDEEDYGDDEEDDLF